MIPIHLQYQSRTHIAQQSLQKMDVFAATIPEESRTPLLETIYERDNDNDGTETPLKRPCSDSNNDHTLLSPEPGELAQQVPESPPPVEEDLSRYTRERIKAGLRYIHHTIATGNIIPRTFTFLNLSKEAHNIALDCCEEGETPSKKAGRGVRVRNLFIISQIISARAAADGESDQAPPTPDLDQLLW